MNSNFQQQLQQQPLRASGSYESQHDNTNLTLIMSKNGTIKSSPIHTHEQNFDFDCEYSMNDVPGQACTK